MLAIGEIEVYEMNIRPINRLMKVEKAEEKQRRKWINVSQFERVKSLVRAKQNSRKTTCGCSSNVQRRTCYWNICSCFSQTSSVPSKLNYAFYQNNNNLCRLNKTFGKL